MACNDLQVMEEVLDALTESVQKQQRAKEEVQKRFREEAASRAATSRGGRSSQRACRWRTPSWTQTAAEPPGSAEPPGELARYGPLLSPHTASSRWQAQRQHCAMQCMVCTGPHLEGLPCRLLQAEWDSVMLQVPRMAKQRQPAAQADETNWWL